MRFDFHCVGWLLSFHECAQALWQLGIEGLAFSCRFGTAAGRLGALRHNCRPFSPPACSLLSVAGCVSEFACLYVYKLFTFR